MTPLTATIRFGLITFIVSFILLIISDSDLTLQYSHYDENSHPFAGKIIWIVGASSGIGAYLAVELARAGAEVILSSRRLDQLQSVSRNCSAVGKEPTIVPLDILDDDNRKKAYETIISKFGRIDSIVLNAGRGQRSPALETPSDHTRALMDLNFISFTDLAQLVLPKMIETNKGQIVVVSSLSGKFGTPLTASYSASKHALHGYFDSLRAEISNSNVDISLVCPGPVESEIAESALVVEPTLCAASAEREKKSKKMSAARCAHLIAKGMHNHQPEMWISPQPFLLLAYIRQYTPWLHRKINDYVGPRRLHLYKTGGDLWDIKNIFKVTL